MNALLFNGVPVSAFPGNPFGPVLGNWSTDPNLPMPLGMPPRDWMFGAPTAAVPPPPPGAPLGIAGPGVPLPGPSWTAAVPGAPPPAGPSASPAPAGPPPPPARSPKRRSKRMEQRERMMATAYAPKTSPSSKTPEPRSRPSARPGPSGDPAHGGSGVYVGQYVAVANKGSGVVAYVGPTCMGEGEWVGVLLEDRVGKNDGSINGTRYFQCPPEYGLFVRPGKVILLNGP